MTDMNRMTSAHTYLHLAITRIVYQKDSSSSCHYVPFPLKLALQTVVISSSRTSLECMSVGVMC